MPDRSISKGDQSAYDSSRFDRLMDLLADQALFGLENDEQAELEELLREFPDAATDQFELTAAALHHAEAVAEALRRGDDEVDFDPLPKNVRESLVQTWEVFPESGERHPRIETSPEQRPGALDDRAGRDNRSQQSRWSTSQTSRAGTPLTQQQLEVSANSTAEAELANRRAFAGEKQRSGGERIREVMAWLTAAAALLVALFAWIDGATQDRTEQIAQPLTPAEQRERLLLSEEDVQQQGWVVNDTAWVASPSGEVAGDVVWSDQAQSGYMRFRGLASTKPGEVYQLWIFDRNRPDKYPVDGGVFEVTAQNDTGEIVIPIEPKLFVFDAYQFAVTVEQTGGVVVSDRERLPVLAPPLE